MRTEIWEHEGRTTELRYHVDSRDGVEFLDEVVAEGIHIEVMDDGRIWADINGVFINFRYRSGRAIEMVRSDAGEARLAQAQ